MLVLSEKCCCKICFTNRQMDTFKCWRIWKRFVLLLNCKWSRINVDRKRWQNYDIKIRFCYWKSGTKYFKHSFEFKKKVNAWYCFEGVVFIARIWSHIGYSLLNISHYLKIIGGWSRNWDYLSWLATADCAQVSHKIMRI